MPTDCEDQADGAWLKRYWFAGAELCIFVTLADEPAIFFFGHPRDVHDLPVLRE